MREEAFEHSRLDEEGLLGEGMEDCVPSLGVDTKGTENVVNSEDFIKGKVKIEGIGPSGRC